MSLAIFDLDNTLIAGDSDYLWGQFLVEKELVEPGYYELENQRFYDEYKAGTLNIYEFLEFSLKPLSEHPIAFLQQLHKEFMQKKINDIWLPKAEALLQDHRSNNDFLLIITATNHFVTAPIAQKLGVDDLIATTPEIINNCYSGKIAGIPCFQEGKVARLNDWLADKEFTLKGSYFYSDSYNDMPLLSLVTNPIAVDADERLINHARDNQWQIMSLR